MAGGWSKDGAVQDQIDASVADAVKLARSQLPKGESLIHCEECETEIPEARRKVILGVRLCISCQNELDKQQAKHTNHTQLLEYVDFRAYHGGQSKAQCVGND